MANKCRFALALAALVATASCGGYSSPTTPTTVTGTAVSIPMGASALGSAAYVPNPVTISVGGTVTWTNNDSMNHTATSDTGVFTGSMAPGAKYSYTFPSRGTFAYHCTLHPGMVGSVVVQ